MEWGARVNYPAAPLIRLWVRVRLQTSVSHPWTRKGATLQNFKWIVNLQNFRSPAKKWKADHKKWCTVNQNSFTLTWRKMNVISNQCSLKWSGLKWMWSQITVVWNECGLKWSFLKWRGLKRMWTQMKKVSNEQVSNERGLKWMVSTVMEPLLPSFLLEKFVKLLLEVNNQKQTHASDYLLTDIFVDEVFIITVLPFCLQWTLMFLCRVLTYIVMYERKLFSSFYSPPIVSEQASGRQVRSVQQACTACGPRELSQLQKMLRKLDFG